LPRSDSAVIGSIRPEERPIETRKLTSRHYIHNDNMSHVTTMPARNLNVSSRRFADRSCQSVLGPPRTPPTYGSFLKAAARTATECDKRELEPGGRLTMNAQPPTIRGKKTGRVS